MKKALLLLVTALSSTQMPVFANATPESIICKTGDSRCKVPYPKDEYIQNDSLI